MHSDLKQEKYNKKNLACLAHYLNSIRLETREIYNILSILTKRPQLDKKSTCQKKLVAFDSYHLNLKWKDIWSYSVVWYQSEPL